MDIIDSVISKTSALYDLAKRFDSQELRQKIADLQEELITVQATCNDLRKENSDLRKKNFDLQEKIQTLEDVIIGRLVFKKTAYFYQDNDEAFCPGCVDGDHVPMRLVPTTGTIPAKIYKCPRCKNTYRLH
jgi:FtsZ-binding cell division protein ZapB